MMILNKPAKRFAMWCTRTIVAFFLLSLIYPSTHRAPLQSPQTIDTSKPHICVHTDLKDEVDEWKIQRSLQLIREMGATTIVEFFPWAYFEPTPGNRTWHQADRIIRHAENQGIQVIARLGLVPGWARPEGTPANTLPDDSFDEFAAYAAAFVARYPTIKHIIVWNEPNLAFEWGFGDFSPERYAKLLSIVYPAVKAVDPTVTVLAGALAPTLEPDGSPNGLDDLMYLRRMFEAGSMDYFDALAVHTYGFTAAPYESPAPDTLNFRRVELLREIVLNFVDDMPMYITESGWNDNPRWNRSVTPSERIAYTLEAFNWAEQNSEWMSSLCLWIFRHPRPTYRYPDNFMLVTTEFEIKPIYRAIQRYAHGIAEDDITGEPLWLQPPDA